ncbi:pilin [Patescibacteria group bacterium]|nr:pilin [Patescibacteria group bacterium]
MTGKILAAIPEDTGGVPFTNPRGWLGTLDPGNGWPKAQGIDFFTKQLIPFLISGALFIVFVLSLIFLVWGGIMWITSGGNKEGAAKAKATITYALVGLIIAILAFLALNIIGQFFGVNLLGDQPPRCVGSYCNL